MSRGNTRTHTIDCFIGNKVYLLRLAKGMSRQQLADIIDVTHQQLQKYEKGLNRISASRLVLIADALGKDVGYFYDGLDSVPMTQMVTQHQRMCIEVARNFMKIPSAEHQNAVNTLIKSLVSDCNNSNVA